MIGTKYKIRVGLSLAVAMLIFPVVSQAGVAQTKHNLSTSGPGSIKASQESEICVFCHTPHNSSPEAPLWNRSQSGANYTPYSSSTAAAAPGQPDGASLLCLSCHDGTIALGDVLSRAGNIQMQGGVTTMPTGPGRLGTDLSDDHPISFLYADALSNGELVSPGSLNGPVKLDSAGKVQCTSCHDPHQDDNGKFLVLSNQGGTLCESCHIKDQWQQSPHNSSNATWDGTTPDPWPTSIFNNVQDNACVNCHLPHNAGSNERILLYANEEDNCRACHNGHVAQENIMSEFNKFSRHPITSTTGVHDPAEQNVIPSRHVECVDCHNPHAARSGNGNPAGPLTGIRGVGIDGSTVDPINNEYELCFRCHGDSPNRPAADTTRQINQTNTRLEFVTSNPSFHPVAGPGQNPNVPSLINGLSTGSTIQCTSCHNNNNGPGTGGGGPAGPHGSSNPNLLERQYVTQDFTSESSSNYALCYKCHDRNIVLSNQSFPLHQKHVVGEQAPCNACHDPHGISGSQGNSINNTHLINFDTNIVNPTGGQLMFEDRGTFAGACYLSCHGRTHDPCTYGDGMGGMGGMCGMGGGGGGGGH